MCTSILVFNTFLIESPYGTDGQTGRTRDAAYFDGRHNNIMYPVLSSNHSPIRHLGRSASPSIRPSLKSSKCLLQLLRATPQFSWHSPGGRTGPFALEQGFTRSSILSIVRWSVRVNATKPQRIVYNIKLSTAPMPRRTEVWKQAWNLAVQLLSCSFLQKKNMLAHMFNRFKLQLAMFVNKLSLFFWFLPYSCSIFRMISLVGRRTAAIRSGIEWTNFWQYSAVISEIHASLIFFWRSSADVGFLSATFLFNIVQTFSITFRSGELPDQGPSIW